MDTGRSGVCRLRVKVEEWGYAPERAYEGDAGYDLRSPSDFVIDKEITVDTGVHVEIPEGYVGILKSKSGLNVKHSIIGTGVIDSGYRGSIKVKLYNLGVYPHEFKRGDKLIQLVIYPVYTPEIEVVDELSESERGERGFGSSGR